VQRVVKGIPAALTLPVEAQPSSGTITITRDRDGVTVVNAAAVTTAANSVSSTSLRDSPLKRT
jgi:hypothetical protein